MNGENCNYREYWGITGTTPIFGSGFPYPISLQEIPINKKGIAEYKCISCGRRIIVNFDLIPVVFVLECPSCNSQNLEKIK